MSENVLPIDEVLPELLETLNRKNSAVLVAPPGAGKTTRVPLVLLHEPWLQDRRIIILEPRRLAARAAAERMAQMLGEKVGETVGLRVRLGSKITQKTRIEVVTEGIFTRMILDDPTLEGVAAVLFDEFHERSLDADLGLALALDAQGALREDLRLVVMSATLDGARVSKLLRDARVIESKGRSFPVETNYLGRNPQVRIEEQVVQAVLKALREEKGSLLVFLPGQGEIRRVEGLLEKQNLGSNCHVYALYGALTPEEQNRAIHPAPSGIRKIVLATTIAETSLTIEGVRVIIDSGLTRVPEYEPAIGLTRLKTVRVSQASANQRQGRAGRMEPGICYRLWEEAATLALEPFSKPEILSADLSSFLLDCAFWGVHDPEKLLFLDPPPKPAISEARNLLQRLEAIDSKGHITELGKNLRDFPLPVHLSRMILEAAQQEQAQDAADLAAVFVERGLGVETIDLAERVERFRKDRSHRARDMRRLSASLARMADGKNKYKEKPEKCSWGELLAKAYPDRIAKQRGQQGEYLMLNGRAGRLEPYESLARETFLVVAEIGGQAVSARISAACALPEDKLEKALGSALQEITETVYDPNTKNLKTRSVRRAGALILSEKPLSVPANEESAHILVKGIKTAGLECLPWSKSLIQWCDRVQFLRRCGGEEWPDVSKKGLLDSLEVWLVPFLVGKTGINALRSQELSDALHNMLSWEQQRRLDQEAPTHFEAPTGSHVPIDYSAEEPVLAIRVQELFGLGEHPCLAQKRIPLVLHLLSPAHRPVQITRDLPGFWRGSWNAVKADMKGRYPKHPWPDDPLHAQPTRKAKPRS